MKISLCTEKIIMVETVNQESYFTNYFDLRTANKYHQHDNRMRVVYFMVRISKIDSIKNIKNFWRLWEPS